MRIIVGYASAHGSTAEIAERVGAVLRRDGADADVRALRNVSDVGSYDAAVLGSAVHNQKWLPEATEFLGAHSAGLAGKPVWMFSVGMSGGLPRPLRRVARDGQAKKIEAELRKFVAPRGHRVFSGVCAPGQMPRWIGRIFRAIGGRFGDYRDWDDIESWAAGIGRATEP